jgi:hypothetical protein
MTFQQANSLGALRIVCQSPMDSINKYKLLMAIYETTAFIASQEAASTTQ